MHPERLAEHVERLAQHAVRGEVWAKAVTYLRHAGVRAVGRGAAREARGFLEQAITLVHRLPKQQSTLELAFDLRIEMQTSLAFLDEVNEALGYVHEAKALAESLGDPARLGHALTILSDWLWTVGDLNQAVEAGHEAQRIAETVTTDPALQVRLGIALGFSRHALGQYDQAVTALEAALRQFDSASSRNLIGLGTPPTINCRLWLAFTLSDLGRLAEAWTRSDEAMAVAESLGQPNALLATCGCAGYLHARFGDPAKAIPPLERALAILQTVEFAGWGIWIHAYLGYAYATVGRFAEALSHLERTLGLEASRRNRPNLAWMLSFVSEAYLLGDRLDEASAIADRALHLARSRRERGVEAQVLWLTGEIAAHRDSTGTPPSDRRYRDALDLATELGMRPLVAHCHLGLSTVYRRTGDQMKAHKHLTIATTMYREMGMNFWLEKAEAEHSGGGR